MSGTCEGLFVTLDPAVNKFGINCIETYRKTPRVSLVCRNNSTFFSLLLYNYPRPKQEPSRSRPTNIFHLRAATTSKLILPATEEPAEPKEIKGVSLRRRLKITCVNLKIKVFSFIFVKNRRQYSGPTINEKSLFQQKYTPLSRSLLPRPLDRTLSMS